MERRRSGVRRSPIYSLALGRGRDPGEASRPAFSTISNASNRRAGTCFCSCLAWYARQLSARSRSSFHIFASLGLFPISWHPHDNVKFSKEGVRGERDGRWHGQHRRKQACKMATNAASLGKPCVCGSRCLSLPPMGKAERGLPPPARPLYPVDVRKVISQANVSVPPKCIA